jgi:hypothetical protein
MQVPPNQTGCRIFLFFVERAICLGDGEYICPPHVNMFRWGQVGQKMPFEFTV